MTHTNQNLLFRIHSGKILNFLSVWMKSMMIRMLKARDVPTYYRAGTVRRNSPDISVSGEGCTFIASLLQKDPNRRRDQNELLTIGFIIYKLDDDKTYDFSK